jgi:hypothetical protein
MSAEAWDWSLRVFDHVEVHASDYGESVRFYEMVLAALGIPRVAEGDDWTGFANLNVVNRRPPTQNLHLCLYAREKEQVDAFHRAGVRVASARTANPATGITLLGTTRRTCSTPTATTSKPSIATSATSATTQLQRSGDIPALNVILARWWRPLSGADSGGGG